MSSFVRLLASKRESFHSFASMFSVAHNTGTALFGGNEQQLLCASLSAAALQPRVPSRFLRWVVSNAAPCMREISPVKRVRRKQVRDDLLYLAKILSPANDPVFADVDPCN